MCRGSSSTLVRGILYEVKVWYRRITRTGVIALVSLTAACNNTSFFLPENALSGEVDIITADDGAVRGVDESYRVSVGVPENMVFEGLEIDFVAENDTVNASFERSRDDLGADLYADIPLADLTPGLFTVEIRVIDGNETLASERSRLFVVENDYAVSGVSAFPAKVFPGAKALLRTTVESNESSAWIRWSENGTVVASGPVSDGFHELEWQSTEKEGVHRFRVDLYPFEPADENGYSFESEISARTEVYVSRGEDAEEGQLGPVDSYFSLLRLRGNVRDEGVRSSLNEEFREGELFGAPELRAEQDTLGYYLDGTNGFELDGVAVPFLGSSLAPFSLNARLRAAGTPSDAILFSTEDQGGEFRLELRTDSDGIPRLVLENAGMRGESSARYPVFQDDSVRLSVSVSPGTEYTTILWFVDGRLASIDRINVGFPSSPLGNSPSEAARKRVVSDPDELTLRDGTTRFGDESSGFVGVIEEFGVYFRDGQDRLSTDDALFEGAMESVYASRLAYAQGFEGLFLPEELETVGRVTVRAGELVLAPDSSVYFPAFLFEDEDLIIEVELGENAREARGELAFAEAGSEDDRAHLMTAVTDGGMRFGEDEVVESFAGAGGDTLLLRIRHENGSLYVRGGQGEERVIELRESRFDGIRMSARHPRDRSVPLRIMSVLAHRDRTELAERLDFSWDE